MLCQHQHDARCDAAHQRLHDGQPGGCVTAYPGLAVVALEGVAPTPEMVASGKYPMSRPLYLVTDGPATGRAKEFIDYVLSPEGQQLLTRHGYLTLAQLGS
ncbi:MAG: substrate-binding domain-containing protein [Pseudonocardiaceae bacterium]